MVSKAKQIEDALSQFNMSDGVVNETIKKEIGHPLLVATISNMFEANFLASLCSKNQENAEYIELCIKIKTGMKPLGFIPFTFNTIQKIHEYNNNILLELFINNKLSRLRVEQEICLG